MVPIVKNKAICLTFFLSPLLYQLFCFSQKNLVVVTTMTSCTCLVIDPSPFRGTIISKSKLKRLNRLNVSIRNRSRYFWQPIIVYLARSALGFLNSMSRVSICVEVNVESNSLNNSSRLGDWLYVFHFFLLFMSSYWHYFRNREALHF